ncbi:ABC transporter permease [Rhizohabitans arisaemae]|uniref:ABC transporter permease n=1 Tax=Rhizohabitans arisaemae TaxID=2720610 RepID=UPI0024B16EFD|nr:ABC transporter permease [Rhizohabitans arisaemae]
MTVRKVLRGAIGVAGFLLVAEAAGRLGLIDPTILPLTSTVLGRTIGLAADGDFLSEVGATLLACFAGLLIAIVLAVPAGVALGTLPKVERATRPLLEFLRPIPSLALIPLALFVFIPTHNAKIALIVYACTWPLLINTMYGVRDVDPLAKETLRSFGFGSLAVLWRVTMPSTAPFIATGIRLAASVTLIVAVSVELVAGGEGIGAFLTHMSTGAGNMDFVLAGTIWAGAIGLVANFLLTGAERRLFRWHQERVGGTS